MTDLSARLSRLEKSFFNHWVQLYPMLGSDMGLHVHDIRIPVAGHKAIQDEIKVLKRFQKEFTAIHPEKLPPSAAIDRDVALYVIRLWLFEREELKLWESCPVAAENVGHSVFQLLSRNFAPLPERIKSIVTRMEKLPRYLLQTREQLTRPVKLYVEIELDTLTRLPGYFNLVKDVARLHASMAVQNRVNRAIDVLQGALEQYTDWLIIDVLPQCAKEFSVGEEKFVKLLRLRGISESLSGMVADAQDHLRRLKDQAQALVRRIRKRASLDDVREDIRAQHPSSFDDVLKYVRDSVRRSKQFAVQSKFATMPPEDNLYVIETPVYRRHLVPFGAYWGPGRFETKKDGYYFVTPGDSENDKLKDHNFPSLSNMTIHEAYPGHHFQHSCANQHPSLIRSFYKAPETTEGWALYCEDRAKELGFEDTPANRFVQISDLMLRAARVVVDIKLNTGKMSVVEARDFLVENAWLDRASAEAEVKRYSITPTQALSYFYGMRKIEDLKKHVREEMKGKFTETFFHDALLYSGSIPMSFMKREVERKVHEALTRKPAPVEGEAGKPPETPAKPAPEPPQKKAPSKPKPVPKVKPPRPGVRKKAPRPVRKPQAGKKKGRRR